MPTEPQTVMLSTAGMQMPAHNRQEPGASRMGMDCTQPPARGNDMINTSTRKRKKPTVTNRKCLKSTQQIYLQPK